MSGSQLRRKTENYEEVVVFFSCTAHSADEFPLPTLKVGLFDLCPVWQESRRRYNSTQCTNKSNKAGDLESVNLSEPSNKETR